MPEKQWEVLPPEQQPPRGGAAPKDYMRLAIAFAIAIMSDGLSVWLEFAPPLQWALDIMTAGLLFLTLGRQLLLLPALITEAIPGLAVFPAWVLVVGSIAVWGSVRK